MIKEIELSSMASLIRTLNSLPNHFIYRGHADAEWKLQSSLERIIGSSWSEKNVKLFEEFSLNDFRSKFHLYDRENVKPDSKLAWLSIMQHYGVPTRLLDFTESPYVALYFALEMYMPQFRKDFSVFALDYKDIQSVAIKYIKQRDNKFSVTKEYVQDNQDHIFESIVDRFSYDVVWTAEPKLLNSRLDRQAGSFLLSGNRNLRIQDILDSPMYNNVKMIKYRIPFRFYSSVFALLRKMNINSKSLYGNLDGLARAIKMQMQVYSDSSSTDIATPLSRQSRFGLVSGRNRPAIKRLKSKANQ